ncbi:hypothetical protein ACLB2K_052479 [Fragaria x ananassa]
MTTLDVVFRSMARLNDFRSVIIKPGGMGRGRVVRASWKPPPHDIVKINVDGSFILGTHSGSTGFVIRDNLGSFLACRGHAHKGVVSVDHVEVLACKQAIVFAIASNFQPAIIETDAQVVYLQLINHHQANLSILGRLYDDIGSMIQDSGSVRIMHTKRSANRMTHLVADSVIVGTRICHF